MKSLKTLNLKRLLILGILGTFSTTTLVAFSSPESRLRMKAVEKTAIQIIHTLHTNIRSIKVNVNSNLEVTGETFEGKRINISYDMDENKILSAKDEKTGKAIDLNVLKEEAVSPAWEKELDTNIGLLDSMTKKIGPTTEVDAISVLPLDDGYTYSATTPENEKITGTITYAEVGKVDPAADVAPLNGTYYGETEPKLQKINNDTLEDKDRVGVVINTNGGNSLETSNAGKIPVVTPKEKVVIENKVATEQHKMEAAQQHPAP